MLMVELMFSQSVPCMFKASCVNVIHDRGDIVSDVGEDEKQHQLIMHRSIASVSEGLVIVVNLRDRRCDYAIYVLAVGRLTLHGVRSLASCILRLMIYR